MVLVVVMVGISWPMYRGHVVGGFSMSLSMFC